MNKRPDLNITLDYKIFKEYYYLKDELVEFCRKNNLQTTGNKIELTERIAKYLKTGERTYTKTNIKKHTNNPLITLDTIIEENIVCSEELRTFYKQHIGKNFSFNVIFQKWLKNNAGKTYKDSINAYYQILEEKKNNKITIDKQFEYNSYIRDFFKNNKNKNLEQAIKCWRYKKSLKGHNKYEKDDLKILDN